MIRPLSFASILALAAFLAPSFAFAQTDRYADAVIEGQNQFFNASSALGAPDRLYADNFSGGGTLKLDLGEGEEGTGSLTLYYEVLNPQVQVIVDLQDASGNLLYSQGGYAPLANIWVFAYEGTTPYRYVVIRNTGTVTLRIDAVESAGVVGGVSEEPAVSVEPEEVIEKNPLRGSIVRLVDDWNDATESDKTIYLLDAGNKRHIVPNEAVFKSWSLSFDDATYVGTGTLTGMELKQNVTVRPGSSLVKIQANPKVYAVTAGGVLRWITTEEIAAKLYGADWAKRVIDVPEVFFVQYKQGAAITEAKYAAGSFVKDDGGSVWYVGAEGKRASVSAKVREALALKDEFLTTGMTTPEFFALHPLGDKLTYTDDLRWPY